MEQIISGKFQPRDDNWVPACWQENRNKFPPEELLQYVGKHIAWSWDGSHIVASANDDGELFDKVAALGMNPSRVVYDYVDPPDVIYVGEDSECDSEILHSGQDHV